MIDYYITNYTWDGFLKQITVVFLVTVASCSCSRQILPYKLESIQTELSQTSFLKNAFYFPATFDAFNTYSGHRKAVD